MDKEKKLLADIHKCGATITGIFKYDESQFNEMINDTSLINGMPTSIKWNVFCSYMYNDAYRNALSYLEKNNRHSPNITDIADNIAINMTLFKYKQMKVSSHSHTMWVIVTTGVGIIGIAASTLSYYNFPYAQEVAYAASAVPAVLAIANEALIYINPGKMTKEKWRALRDADNEKILTNYIGGTKQQEPILFMAICFNVSDFNSELYSVLKPYMIGCYYNKEDERSIKPIIQDDFFTYEPSMYKAIATTNMSRDAREMIVAGGRKYKSKQKTKRKNRTRRKRRYL
jgi:hypothetical protein